MYDDIVSKELGRAYVMTFEQFTSARTVNCSEQNTCAGSHPYGTVLNDGLPFVIQEAQGDYSCTCIEARNFLSVGPENLGLGIHHTFETSPKFGGGLRGSTAVAGKETSPVTTIKRKPNFDNSESSGTVGPPPLVFQPGNHISVSVKQLLDIAFAKDPDALDYVSPLDERMRVTHPGELAPYRRLSGVVIDLDFVYSISAKASGGVREQVTCDLEVSYSEGMVSWKPPVQITRQRDIDHESSVRRDYTAITERGVLIRMHARGQVSQFNFYNLIDALVQLAVLLPLATTVVVYFAIYAPELLNPRQAIYNAAVKEDLNYDREMSKFAATAALATATFQKWDVDSDGTVDGEELKRIFIGRGAKGSGSVPGFNEETAEKFSRQILEAADNDNTHSLDVEQLIDILSSDLCNIHALKKHVSSRSWEKAHSKHHESRRPRLVSNGSPRFFRKSGSDQSRGHADQTTGHTERVSRASDKGIHAYAGGGAGLDVPTPTQAVPTAVANQSTAGGSAGHGVHTDPMEWHSQTQAAQEPQVQTHQALEAQVRKHAVAFGNLDGELGRVRTTFGNRAKQPKPTTHIVAHITPGVGAEAETRKRAAIETRAGVGSGSGGLSSAGEAGSNPWKWCSAGSPFSLGCTPAHPHPRRDHPGMRARGMRPRPPILY
jgi:hypothetical protein